MKFDSRFESIRFTLFVLFETPDKMILNGGCIWGYWTIGIAYFTIKVGRVRQRPYFSLTKTGLRMPCRVSPAYTQSWSTQFLSRKPLHETPSILESKLIPNVQNPYNIFFQGPIFTVFLKISFFSTVRTSTSTSVLISVRDLRWNCKTF